MEPTPEECASFDKVGAVMDWADITGDLKGVVCDAFGITESDNIRSVAAITDEQVTGEVVKMSINGVPLKLGNRAKVVLFARACRITMGAELRATEAQAKRDLEDKEKAQQISDALAGATRAVSEAKLAAEAAAKAAEHSKPAAGTTVQLKTVVSQGLEEVVPALGPDDLKKHFEAVEAVFKRPPAPEEECSTDQLTGLHTMLARDVASYMDLGVWGPFHHRLRKKIRLTGMQLSSNGVITNVELVGPPDVDAWSESYRLLVAGLLGFNAVSYGNLLDYGKKIRDYVEMFGYDVWPLLYQADVRCRLEHMERLRRQLEKGAAKANALNREPAIPFDPLKAVGRRLAGRPEGLGLLAEAVRAPCFVDCRQGGAAVGRCRWRCARRRRRHGRSRHGQAGG